MDCQRCLCTVLATVILLAAGSGNSASAGTVNWSGTFLSTNLTSTSQPLDGSFLFRLGAFDSGFTPSSSNTADWAAHWHTASVGFYNPTTRFFTGTFAVSSNASPFGLSDRGYIWGVNCSNSQGEWVLISSPSWTWPQAGGTGTAVDWSVASATQAIVGQINNPGFLIKTARISAPVPVISKDEWLTASFTAAERANSAISGWNADADGDGLNNTLEYCLGLNPKSASSTWNPTASSIVISEQSYAKLSVTKCSYAGGTLSIESSSNLQNWSSAPSDVVTVANTADLLEARDALPILAGQHRFLRLRATLPP